MDSRIDLDDMLERFDNDRDVLQEVVKLFIEECPKLMEDVRRAIARKDAASLDHAAHTLKGSISNFSAMTAQAALKLERMGRSGNLAGAEQAFTALEQEMTQLVPALGALIAERTSA